MFKGENCCSNFRSCFLVWISIPMNIRKENVPPRRDVLIRSVFLCFIGQTMYDSGFLRKDHGIIWGSLMNHRSFVDCHIWLLQLPDRTDSGGPYHCIESDCADPCTCNSLSLFFYQLMPTVCNHKSNFGTHNHNFNDAFSVCVPWWRLSKNLP